MTTVRMSAKVVDKILENAATAFIKANPLKQYEETLGDRIYDSALVNVIPIFQQISKLDEIDSNSVLDNNSYIDVSIDGIHTNEYPDPGGSDFSYRPKLTSHYSSIRVPTSTQKLYFSHQNNVEISGVSDLGQEMLQILEYNKTVSDNLDEHINKVKSIIESCVTVNQFIKAWPAGSSLVPEEALKKANERSVRKQAAEDRRALVEGMETDLNTSILTSSLLD